MSAISDPIADMLTRIRNAIMAKHQYVQIPLSKMKKNIAVVLQEEGYIESFEVISQEPQDILSIHIRYKQRNRAAIEGLKRISTPGRRVYADTRHIPRVLNGLGIAILSTSSGVISDKTARDTHAGGEVLCYVW